MTHSPLIFIPLILLILSIYRHDNLPRVCLFCLMIVLAFFYVKITIKHPTDSQLQGKGIFDTAHLKLKQQSSNNWIYIGYLKKFETSSGDCYYNIPCSISIPNKEDIHRPLANKSYLVEGKLKRHPRGFFSLEVNLKKQWYPIPWSFSLAEHRYMWKKNFSDYLTDYYRDSRVRNFLKGLCTGDFTDRTLGFQLSRFGLQHIMAISGFHFALVAAVFYFIFNAFFRGLSSYCLLLSLTLYFIFLGCSPSIMRAWISIMIFLIGTLLQKKGSALNNLGIALLIILLLYPEMGTQIGFQMSFLATLAILTIYPILDFYFGKIFNTRSLATMITMNHSNQWAYCILMIFRKSFALTLSVLILTLPLSIFYFNKFPLLGVIFNLFFPFLTSLSMTLLILGGLLTLVFPSLGTFIHHLNQVFTHFTLNFAYNIPRNMDFNLEGSLSHAFVVLYLSLIFLLILTYQNRLKENSLFNPKFL